MARKVDEVFEYKFNWLKVHEDIEGEGCEACFFQAHNGCNKVEAITGSCSPFSREDELSVIFKIEEL